MTCCKILVRGQFEAMPFRRVIATGFYDGPIQGFTECSKCGQAFSFRMLDWDDSQAMRIFAFSPVSTTLDTIAERLRIALSTDAEFAMLGPLTEQDDGFVRELEAQPPTRVAAFEGWPGKSSLCRDVTRIDLADITDWFSYLEIPRTRA